MSDLRQTSDQKYDELLANGWSYHSGGGGNSSGDGSSGTTNYNNLSNKPKIGNVELKGNKTLSDLGIASKASVEELNDQLESKASDWDSKSDFSGSYNDLTNKPTIPDAYDDTAIDNRVSQLESKASDWDSKSDFSGSYNDLTNKPTIPDAYDDTAIDNRVSQLESKAPMTVYWEETDDEATAVLLLTDSDSSSGISDATGLCVVNGKLCQTYKV